MARDGEVEAGRVRLARAERVGHAGVAVRDVSRRAGRRPLGGEHVRIGRLQLVQHLAAARAEQPVRPDVRRGRGEEERALAAEDLESRTGRVRGHARHLDRCLGAAREAAGDGDAVRCIDGDIESGLLVAPLGDARGHARGDLRDLAEDRAERVDGVPARDRERVRAVRAHCLPDPAGAALEHRLRHHAQVRGQHLAHVPLRDEVAGVADAGVAAALEPDGRAQRLLAREVRHLLGLRERGPQRPLAEHVLARAQRRHHELVMQRHAHRHDDEVDIRVRHYRVDVVEGEGRAEALGGGLRRVLVRGADRHELVVREGVEGGHMGVRAPAAPPGRHGRAHDANADGVCHRSLHSLRRDRSRTVVCTLPAAIPASARRSPGARSPADGVPARSASGAARRSTSSCARGRMSISVNPAAMSFRATSR